MDNGRVVCACVCVSVSVLQVSVCVCQDLWCVRVCVRACVSSGSHLLKESRTLPAIDQVPFTWATDL